MSHNVTVVRELGASLIHCCWPDPKGPRKNNFPFSEFNDSPKAKRVVSRGLSGVLFEAERFHVVVGDFHALVVVLAHEVSLDL